MPVDMEALVEYWTPFVEDVIVRLAPHCNGKTAEQLIRDELAGHEAAWVRLRGAVEDDCRPCMYASIFGWWGPPLLKDLNAHTHCKVCHRSWRGTKQAHCTVCHEHFSSAEAASKHWVNDKHVHPSEVKGRDGGPRFCLSEEEQEFGAVWTLCRHQVAAA